MLHSVLIRDSSKKTLQAKTCISDYIPKSEAQVVSLEATDQRSSRDHAVYIILDVHFFSSSCRLPLLLLLFFALLLRAEIQYCTSPYEEIGKERLCTLGRSLSWNYANKQSFSGCHKHSIISVRPFSPLQFCSVSASLINPIIRGLGLSHLNSCSAGTWYSGAQSECP